MTTAEQHFRKLENMYHGAPVNQVIRHQLQVRDGEATLEWEVDPSYFHAAGSLHGALYFKMLDDAAFFAANSAEREYFALTASFHLHFLRPVLDGHLRAEGRLISRGRQLLLAESVLYDHKGREVARGSGSFARSRMRLTEDIGYK